MYINLCLVQFFAVINCEHHFTWIDEPDTNPMPVMVFYKYFRYPDFIAPCVGVHPVQSLCPDRSATLEVRETAFKSEFVSPHNVLIPAQMNISLFY